MGSPISSGEGGASPTLVLHLLPSGMVVVAAEPPAPRQMSIGLEWLSSGPYTPMIGKILPHHM